MTTFESLRELAEELQVGDKVLWIGSHAIEGAGETSRPNTVTRIEFEENFARVDGEGFRGGTYHFTVEDEKSRAYHHSTSESEPTYQGEVVVARLTDSDEPVPVKRVFDDIRGESAQKS
ncbi:hypothetical protein [Haloplanus rubicundus]|uniref:hypothetical protein n=1 Tax=Haloplanus rubicundus TaxID=1547898 RepID=UPI001300781E|nr:hypothetical protein [Haloplanus rubicundus]